MYLPRMSLMLFHLLALVFCYQASRYTDEIDKQALLEFQSNLSENSRVVLASWNDSLAVCKWTGVVCGHKHKRVTASDLSGMKLTGVISPSIGNLSFLKSLSLADNSLHGSIPLEVGKLFSLQHLNLSKNILGGVIPLGISNCSALLTNDVSYNNLEHEVPSEQGSLPLLVLLSLHGNYLHGKFPASFGNLTSLQKLDVEGNYMTGEIPDSMSRLTQMKFLQLARNKFSGFFPHAICNLSSLQFLSITRNSFSGKLRLDVDKLFPNIQEIFLSLNDFEGEIPVTLANITSLRRFEIAENQMTGSISSSFGRLKNMEVLVLSHNSLGSYSSRDLGFLSSLSNCTQLQSLNVGYNRLGGDLPLCIANLSNQLTYLSLEGNSISGSIPLDIGNLEILRAFNVEQNLLTGELPSSLGKLSRLERLHLQSNMLAGNIPSFFGNLTMIAQLYLYDNTFMGSIPSSLRNCSNLLFLGMDFNMLRGSIPRELMEVRSLVYLNISYNNLTGQFPSEVGKLVNLVQLDVSHNQLSGNIPQTLGSCLCMEELELNGNLFEGTIIDPSGLRNLRFLDLSNNNLTGPIPVYVVNYSSIQYLNLSVNNLEGPVPVEVTYLYFTQVSIFGNRNLCGGIPELHLKPCSVQKKVVIGIGVGVTLVLVSILAIIFLCWFKKRSKNNRASNGETMDFLPLYERVRYKELHNATGGFSMGNIIGSGNFGVVYKASLGLENRAVAIKVLNLKKHGAAKSFIAECEALKGLRHRNLVKLVTACSSIDYKGNEFRSLVYEFMPNGSLDMWLHQEGTSDTSRPLTLLERFNIAIDLASVLDYLHVNSHDPIAHCDIKPSNVLLDDDLTAHVSDFGLARLLHNLDQESYLNQLSSAGVRGTIGYAAPEYGMGGQPSIYGDVYSFGVLLLEMFTGKRPTDELFGGNVTLHSYTESAFPGRVLDIADRLLLHRGLRVGFPAAECLTMVLEVGLRCCEEFPTNRLTMSEAIKELFSIRRRFFKARITARS
ncbi:PREDICTED: putative receptor-like protein kinase At3g47110 [Camelina sativa]|uniref:Receptor-like protein kinase At3g47110 n=1 Tax=Camelina sativa TaxID=90675 RepID=A0ABM1Q6R8_CAMSA|nr:PREDICTED: putative receptor-like protein kinase At3g47110 [Camelina sativa]